MKVLDVATSVAGGVSVTDSQSGFRAYGKRVKSTAFRTGFEALNDDAVTIFLCQRELQTIS